MTAKILNALPKFIVNAALFFISSLFICSALGITISVAYAETNAEGDEITIVSDNGADIAPNLTLTPNLSNPALNYLPDQVIADADNSDNDLRQRIINGYGMPNIDSGYTSTHESFYASRPD